MRLIPCFFALSVLVGCQFPSPNAPSGGDDQPQAHQTIPKASQDELRRKDREEYAKKDAEADEKVDEIEKEALKAIRMAVGKQAWGPGQEAPLPSSTAIKQLRAAKVKLRLETIKNEDGKAVDDNFLDLHDSYSDRVTQLHRKIVEQRASKSELRELQEGSKHIMKINDVRQPVSALSSAAYKVNLEVTQMHFGHMLDVSMSLRSRKLVGMDFDDADYTHVKAGLARLKRIEALAATTLAMLGTYQAVLNDGGDPKAIDIVAEGALKAFPIKVETTEKEARDYVKNLGGNIAKVKARYEGWMRKAYGDAAYERKHKAQFDALFQMAESAQTQKSVFQIRDEQIRAAQADRAARLGEPAPAPAAARAKSSESPPANAPSSVADTTVDGALDAAGKVFPSDGSVGAALQGISALRKGDAKGAIGAALSFVPVPGLKDAFGVASKLLFKSS